MGYVCSHKVPTHACGFQPTLDLSPPYIHHPFLTALATAMKMTALQRQLSQLPQLYQVKSHNKSL
jgi:hypothetical protein